MPKTPLKKLAANKRYRTRNREAVLYHKRNNRLRRFGLEPSDLDRMLAGQNHTCIICHKVKLKRDGRAADSAHIDHCHDCGQIRGLVCKRCNALVGFIESDYDAFIAALEFHVSHVIDNHEVLKEKK